MIVCKKVRSNFILWVASALNANLITRRRRVVFSKNYLRKTRATMIGKIKRLVRWSKMNFKRRRGRNETILRKIILKQI